MYILLETEQKFLQKMYINSLDINLFKIALIFYNKFVG